MLRLLSQPQKLPTHLHERAHGAWQAAGWQSMLKMSAVIQINHKG